MYTGVNHLAIASEIIDNLYKKKKIEITTLESGEFFENEYVHLTDGASKSAITISKNGYLYLVTTKEAMGVRPRNLEQIMAMDALLDDNVRVCVFTGRAGTGKTLISIAAALQKVESKQYKKIILTRPMSQVGKYDLGALPGEVDDKFGPYLQNYMCNFEHLLGDKRTGVEDLINMYNIEFIPMQLIRGASWSNAFIIADEIQTLDYHEMLTLGSRVGENSKLVISGDLGQRDEKIAKEKTGLYKFVNDGRVKKSRLTSSVHLIKCERSEVANLFSDVFES